MAPKKVIPTYAAGSLDSPLRMPEDSALAQISLADQVQIVKPPGVETLREWGEQILSGGKYAGRKFADVLAIDAGYVEFMKKKTDCTSAWALSFHNYVLAMEKHGLPSTQAPIPPVGSQSVIMKAKQTWIENGAAVTDWDIVDDMKASRSSEIQMGTTSLASGANPVKRMNPSQETTQKMKVDMDKETWERVQQIQTQITILQRELSHLMPAEDA